MSKLLSFSKNASGAILSALGRRKEREKMDEIFDAGIYVNGEKLPEEYAVDEVFDLTATMHRFGVPNEKYAFGQLRDGGVSLLTENGTWKVSGSNKSAENQYANPEKACIGMLKQVIRNPLKQIAGIAYFEYLRRIKPGIEKSKSKKRRRGYERNARR